MIKSSAWLVPAMVVALALSACGKEEEEPKSAAPAQPATEASKPAETAVPTEAEQPAETAVADARVAAAGAADGEKVFKTACAMCHQTGAAGAPVVGKKSDWGPRIAQGNAILYERAINGFTGSKGKMPARGGKASLSDAEVHAAVDYMVSKSK